MSNVYQDIKTMSLGDNALSIWHLGQNSTVIKYGDIVCYFDLYLSNYIYEREYQCARNFSTVLNAGEIDNADMVFVSHAHMDHMDIPSLKIIGENNKNAKIVCPKPHEEMLVKAGISARQILLAVQGKKEMIKGVEFTPIAQKHEEYNIDKLGNHGTLGYIIKFGEIIIYFAGDVICSDELIEGLKGYNINIMFLPINGHDFFRTRNNIMGNITFREAVELAHEVGTDVIIPMHYDLFQENTENPAYFVDYLYHKYPFQKFKMMVPGEKYIYIR